MGEPCRLISLEEYEEYKELSRKCLQLEKKLDIAVDALEEYANVDNWDEVDCGQYPHAMFGKWFDGLFTPEYESQEIAQKALKQIEEVK